MTEERLKELAEKAGYTFEKGVTQTEDGKIFPSENGYEVINIYTGEPVTFRSYGEIIHYGYSLKEIEDFLRKLYEEADLPFFEYGKEVEGVENVLKKYYVDADVVKSMARDIVALANVPSDETDTDMSKLKDALIAVQAETTPATFNRFTQALDQVIWGLTLMQRENNNLVHGFVETVNGFISREKERLEEEKRISEKAAKLMPSDESPNAPQEVKKLCEETAEAVRNEWTKENATDYDTRLKMQLICSILDTDNFKPDDSNLPIHTENLDKLANDIFRSKIKQQQEE